MAKINSLIKRKDGTIECVCVNKYADKWNLHLVEAVDEKDDSGTFFSFSCQYIWFLPGLQSLLCHAKWLLMRQNFAKFPSTVSLSSRRPINFHYHLIVRAEAKWVLWLRDYVSSPGDIVLLTVLLSVCIHYWEAINGVIRKALNDARTDRCYLDDGWWKY